MTEKRQGAVAEDGSLRYTSVSAVKKFLGCPAAWFFRYKLRRPEPQGAGALESDGCHKRVEHYLRTGENVLGPIERRALVRGLLPAPGPDLHIEEQLDTLDADGVPFVVKIDCIDPRRVAADGLLVVNDWKFKKDIKKYGAKAEQLADIGDEESGLQMVGYGEAVRRAVRAGRWEGTRTVRLRHVEVDKSRDAAVEVYADVPLVAFEQMWREVAPTVRKMREVACAQDVTLVEANKKACFKYGGCAFKAECPHFKSPASADQLFRLKALFTPKHERSALGEEKEKTMGLLDRMRTAPAVTPPAAAVTPPPATPPPAPAKASLIIDESTESDEVVKARLAAKAPVAQVLPPDAPKPEPVVTHTIPSAQIVSTAPGIVETITVQSPEPKRRGRKPKTEVAGAVPDVLEDFKQSVKAEPSFTLYIGTRSTKLPSTSLLPYVNELERSALGGFKANFKDSQGNPLDLDDIRFSTGPEVGFGRWKAVLAKMAQASPPAPGRYVSPPYGADERVDAVLTALEPLAADVVTR